MNSSKDVRIEADGAVFYFKYLDWDTNFFGLKSYFLEQEKSVLEPSLKLKGLIEGSFKGCFITAKIATRLKREVFDFLQDAGFKHIDTEVTLRYNGKAGSAVKSENETVEIIRVEKNENFPYDELGSVFTLTRFHYDVNIPKEKADMLWINYIKNYVPSPVNHMFIAKYDGEVAGSILVNESYDRKRAMLFFVSIIDRFRGKKIGSKLIREVVENFNGYDIVTGTQSRNINALNYYIRNGFSIIETTRAVMHRW